MFKEIALDPKCMMEYEYFEKLKEFGYDHGRYLIADMSEWAREAGNYLETSDMQPRKLQSIKRWLQKIIIERQCKEGFLPKYRQHIKQADCWYEWVIAQSNHRTFSGITFSTETWKKIKYDKRLKNISNNTTRGWTTYPSIRVEKSAKGVIDVLDRLLRISNEITILDQFICKKNKKEESSAVVREIIDLITKPEYYINKLTILTANEKMTSDKCFTECKVPDGLDLEIKMVIFPEKYFHDRYLITDRGAIMSGQGFSLQSSGDIRHQGKLHLCLITKEDADEAIEHINELVSKGQTFEKTLYSTHLR